MLQRYTHHYDFSAKRAADAIGDIPTHLEGGKGEASPSLSEPYSNLYVLPITLQVF